MFTIEELMINEGFGQNKSKNEKIPPGQYLGKSFPILSLINGNHLMMALTGKILVIIIPHTPSTN